ncbi:MAG TPA: PAS domain S-box protein [Rariglobus sp.]
MQPSTTNPSPVSESSVCPPDSEDGKTREQSLIDACIDPVVVFSAEGRITAVNKAALWMTGLGRDQLLGGDFCDHVVDPEQFRAMWREVAAGGAVESRSLGVRHRFGQTTELICNVSPRLDDQGNVTEVFLSARNVTRQTQVEEALRRSERKFNEAQRVAHVGYWDRDVEADRAVWSEETYRIFGLSPKEEGVTWHDMASLIHPDDRARAMMAIQKALQGGPRYDIEFRVVRPNGEERIIHSQANITLDAAGRAVHMFGTAQDITERKQAEEKLRQANARISEILESITDMFAVFDEDWRYVYVNDQSVQTRGLSREQMLGRSVWEIYPELIGTHAEHKLRLAMAQRVTVDYEIFLPSQKRWFGVHAYPSRDGISTYSQDITERKWAEAKLSNSEARYRALYRDNPVMLFTLDSMGTVLAVNPSGISQLGYSLDELEGQSVLKVFHPDDQEDVARQFQTCLRHPGQVQHWQFRKIRKDGVMLWVDELAQPVRDLNGEVNVLVVCQDITERKRAEEEIRVLNTTLEQRVQDRTRALAESEKRFHTIYDTAPVSIWQEDWSEVIADLAALRAGGVTDFDAYFRQHPEFVGRALEAVKIRDVNQWTVDMFAARTKAQLLASLGTVFATPDTLPGFVGELVALAEGKQTYRTEMSLNTVAGDTIRCFLAMAFPPPGTGSGDVLVSVLDITERKRSEQSVRDLNEQLAARALALELANKELESFSYSVSHDLRGPLRTLDGFSRALLEDYAERLDDEGKDYLLRIRKASQRMGHLIDDMLHLAQVSRSELHREPVNLSALARTVAEGLRAAEPERKIEFVIQPDLTVGGDPRLLQIVMENLFGNACKFSRDRDLARIEFGRTVRDGAAAYYVRDNGVGFDMAYVHKLFGAFHRLHTSAEFPGTGIGLATVQRIVHRHGGVVAAESRPGEGSVFYFTLPEPTPAIP